MGCLVGGNRGARCPFALPTMVTWQGRCPTTGLLTSPFVVRSPPLCCPRSGLTILLFCRVPLTVVWEDLAPLLGGDMRMHTAVVAMYILLGDMYGTMFEEGALQAPEVAQAFQKWVCPAIRSPYINWMLHDATVTIQAIRPYGLGMFSGDLLEGSNRVLKDIWSSFCDRGGGAGTLVSRRIKMLRQVNERLFLYFEVPRWNGTSRSNLCNAPKLADEVRAYFADEELR